MQLTFKKIVFPILFFFFFSFNGHTQLIEPNNPTIETTGDVLRFALPAASITTTLILKDKKGTWQFTKGFVLNAAVTYILKKSINKPRPYHNGDNAFPSGHTSITFQSAAFIHRRYGFTYSVPAYVLAGITAYSRINAQQHDGYDILAGAVVGIGSSFLFTTPYLQEHMALTFSTSGEDSYLLGFTYRF